MYWKVLLNNDAFYVLEGAVQQPRTLCTWMYLKVLLNNHALCVHGCAVQQPRCLTDYKGISRRMQELNTHTHYVQVLHGWNSSTHTHARVRARALYVQVLLRRYSSTHTRTMYRCYLDGVAQQPHTLGIGFI